MAAAARSGLSVCDYVERLWGQAGNTQRIIDEMAGFGALACNRPTVLEVGAGTGRYMAKLLQRCNPIRYESYEIAEDWASWLELHYPIVSQPTDGYSLSSTPSGTIDLIHAHGLFVYIPFLTAWKYWMEFSRVTKIESVIVFDVLTEECFDDESVSKWHESGATYPCFNSKQYICNFFRGKGATLVGSFYSTYGPARSEYLVFRKSALNPTAG